MGYTIKDSGKHREFATGAKRDRKIGKGRFDLMPPATLTALAIHFQLGAEKYAARNWEKGIPIHEYIDSGIRHALQFLQGLDDENHLIAAIWNFVCAYETILRIQEGSLPPELYDLPYKIELPIPEVMKRKNSSH